MEIRPIVRVQSW